MKKEDLRIVFMGTPEFAVETLQALVEMSRQTVLALIASMAQRNWLVRRR